MSRAFWTDVIRLVLPLVPEALVFVAGLIVAIALRRRLGAAAPTAIAGFVLLAVAGLGAVAWWSWVLSRYDILPTMTEQGDPSEPAGLELTQALQQPMEIALSLVQLVGVILVTAAVFVPRSSQHSAVGRSR